MATITITRATNVRRYEDFEVDLDDLTPEQQAAIEQLQESEVLAFNDTEPGETRAFDVLDELFDDWDAGYEDYDAADHPDMSFIGGE